MTTPEPETARTVVLERIRAALAGAPPPAVDIPREYETALPAGTDVIDRFLDRVADYRAEVRRVDDTQLPAAIATVLAAHDVTRIVVPAGVPDAWLGMTGAGLEAVSDDPPLTHTDLDEVDGVLTGCAVGIAETGTIVLDAGPAQGRRAISLLPDLHVCVVMSDQIVGTVAEALARLDPTRPLTWISGPSATSDIELRRVEGVHGPRRLEVVVVDRHDG
jgi:L-lactate dehydrogenase complex protein LldG